MYCLQVLEGGAVVSTHRLKRAKWSCAEDSCCRHGSDGQGVACCARPHTAQGFADASVAILQPRRIAVAKPRRWSIATGRAVARHRAPPPTGGRAP